MSDGVTRAPKVAKFAVPAVIVVLVVGAALYAWASDTIDLKDRFLPKRFAVVEPGAIYRSGQLDRHLVREQLVEHGIRVIVDLQQPNDSPDQAAERAAARELGVETASFPMAGNGTGSVESIAGAAAAIAQARRAGQPVLVHCSAGSRRTGTVLCCYQWLVEGRPLADAEKELARFVDGEEERAMQRQFLLDHRAEIERALAAAGVLDHP